MEDPKSLILTKMAETNKPMRPGEIADATGLDKTIVSKLIKTLKTEDKVYSPKRCFYQTK